MHSKYDVYLCTHPQAVTSSAMFRAVATPLLLHPLGWAQQGYQFRVVQEPRGNNLITITLAPQNVLDTLFPDFQHDRLSVCNMSTREIFLNEARWLGVYADNKSDLSLPAYRAYMVQHEVGHALGFGHTTCTTPGGKCPVMQQQTLGHGACAPYPFPAP